MNGIPHSYKILTTRDMFLLKIFLELYQVKGSAPTIKELVDDGRSKIRSTSVVFYVLKKFVEAGYLIRIGNKFHPVGLREVIRKYIKGGGYSGTIKDRKLKALDEIDFGSKNPFREAVRFQVERLSTRQNVKPLE